LTLATQENLKNPTITGYFEFVFEENLGIIVRTKRKANVFKIKYAKACTGFYGAKVLKTVNNILAVSRFEKTLQRDVFRFNPFSTS